MQEQHDTYQAANCMLWIK